VDECKPLLGGGARTSLIIACSPSTYNAPETITSLRFGQRAKAGRCRLPVSQPELKARLVSALET
jgi:kinesin family protein 5